MSSNWAIAQATKNISGAIDKSTVDHSTVTRWFKKFHVGCKKLYNQARSGWPKTVDSETMFQAKEANPESSTRRESGELTLGYIHPAVQDVCHFVSKVSLTIPENKNRTE